jgi:hypothetical protein
MDFATLAQQSVTLMAPCLPYLLTFGEKITEGAAKEIGADAWKQAKFLWSKIGPKIKQNKSAEEAVRDLSETPTDPDLRTVAKVQIEKLIKQDKDLAGEVDKFFKDLKASGFTIAAIGERSVAAHTISGSTVVTGDQTTTATAKTKRKPAKKK